MVSVALTILTWKDVSDPHARLLGWRLVVLVMDVLTGITASVWALVRWKGTRLYALLPLLVASFGIGGMLAAQRVGWDETRARFLQSAPAYLSVIERVRSGSLRGGNIPLDSLPREIRGCCYQVSIIIDSTGSAYGEFWTDRIPFRPGHIAWMYTDLDTIPRTSLRARGWSEGNWIAPHWMRISD